MAVVLNTEASQHPLRCVLFAAEPRCARPRLPICKALHTRCMQAVLRHPSALCRNLRKLEHAADTNYAGLCEVCRPAQLEEDKHQPHSTEAAHTQTRSAEAEQGPAFPPPPQAHPAGFPGSPVEGISTMLCRSAVSAVNLATERCLELRCPATTEVTGHV